VKSDPPDVPLRVVLIGPESTGKTQLASDLAVHYDVPWSPEYAREYVEGRKGAVEYSDVEAIGRGQKAVEDEARGRASRLVRPLVVLDTDLVSTAVYSRHYYGDCPEWIEREAGERLADLYLLLHVDVGWVADGSQRAQPERRGELFDRFRSALEELDAQVCEIRGVWPERQQHAIECVDRLVSRTPHGGKQLD
jgi:NadR type nicotinamide-nucleotide adenylyltransferase